VNANFLSIKFVFLNNIIMAVVSLLTKAIKSRKPISFEYDVRNKIKGVRYGHPHVQAFRLDTKKF
jgi:hypothetical protein